MAETKGVILVVDDTPANVTVLIDLLQDEGYIIHEARDGQAAVDLVPTACAGSHPHGYQYAASQRL